MVLRSEWGPHVFIEFDDRSIPEFCETLDELSADHDIVLVVIDYFRRIDEFQSEGNIALAQEARSTALSDLAKYYDCHVLCIFDITRSGQNAGRVALNHMKGGTAAQYDADVVLTLNEHSGSDPPREKEVYPSHGMLDMTVAKNRFGTTKTIQLRVDRTIGCFEPVGRGKEESDERRTRR